MKHTFVLLFVCAFASAQDTAALREHALQLRPIQADVEADVPAADEAVHCELIPTDGKTGMQLLDARKQVLRVFVDNSGNKKIDQWSYYLNGVEVYRELDTDGNGKRDQFRWLNTAGTRWGIDVNEDGVIDSWKQISAQEVSREVVLALATDDVQRFLRVALSSEELQTLKLGNEWNETITKKIAKLKSGFAEAVAAVNFQDKKNVEWYQLNAVLPSAVLSDVIVYENTSATVGDGQAIKQIAIGTIVQIGNNNWRTLDVPRIYDDAHPLFTFVQPQEVGVNETTGPADSEVVKLMHQLGELQNSIAETPKEQRAEKHKQAVALLLDIVKKSATNDERENWIRQLADTIMDATGRGEYPDGKEQISKLFNSVNKAGKEELAAHVRQRQIMTDYYVALTAESDQMKAYNTWLSQLEELCNTFKDTEAGLEGMLQLASYKEMAGGGNEESLKWYQKAAESSKKTIADKAKGAMRRLTAEGKAVPFQAKDTNGKDFNVAEAAGHPVLLVFYDSNSANMLPLIKAVTDKYTSRGLLPIGVNVGTDGNAANGWRTLTDGKGLDGALSVYWGIVTPPYMILYGTEGKVVRSSIATAEELQQILGTN